MNSSFMKVARQKIVVPCAVTIAIVEAAANMQSNGAILLPNKLTVLLPNKLAVKTHFLENAV